MDLIERADAIKVTWQEPSYTDAINALTEARERIKDIPSAENKGEWISLHNGKWKCSECGIEVLIYAKGNFCPNCGADMRKGAGNE